MKKTSEFSSALYKKPAITGCCPWNKVVFNIKYTFLLVSQYSKAVHASGNKPTACEFPEFRKAVPSKLRITHCVMCVIILQYACHQQIFPKMHTLESFLCRVK